MKKVEPMRSTPLSSRSLNHTSARRRSIRMYGIIGKSMVNNSTKLLKKTIKRASPIHVLTAKRKRPNPNEFIVRGTLYPSLTLTKNNLSGDTPRI